MGFNGLIGLWLTASANASIAVMPPVCESADHCVWIMENHGPHEFDYQVLSQELLGFGADGKDFLMMLTGDKDKVIAGRALDMLARADFGLNSRDQKELMDDWPGVHVGKRAELLVAIGSPEVQALMINSLADADLNVRLIARKSLASMRANNRIYKLRPQDFDPISKAVVIKPSRELVQMLAAFSNEKSQPVFVRTLKSGDPSSVIAAYDALYAQAPELAFSALMSVIKGLRPDDHKAAFGIGALLRHRHQGRADGFYMQFAQELAEDPKMNVMGRVVGLDALMGGDNVPHKLKASAPVISAFRSALIGKGDNVEPYARNFRQIAADNPAGWASVIWNHLKARPQIEGRVYDDFFVSLRGLAPGAASGIISEAMEQTKNLQILDLGLKSAAMRRDKNFLPAVVSLTGHWSDDISERARQTVRVLGGNASPGRNPFCDISGKTPTDYVEQLPYFTLDEADEMSPLKRRYLKATYPVKDGWLTGFDGGRLGGGIWYFDNESGMGEHTQLAGVQGVTDILPIKIPKLGQYSSDFWVIGRQGGGSYKSLYYIEQTQGGVAAEFRQDLPGSNYNISVLRNGQYLLSSTDQSPLVLRADGQIHKACQ